MAAGRGLLATPAPINSLPREYARATSRNTTALVARSVDEAMDSGRGTSMAAHHGQRKRGSVPASAPPISADLLYLPPCHARHNTAVARARLHGQTVMRISVGAVDLLDPNTRMRWREVIAVLTRSQRHGRRNAPGDIPHPTATWTYRSLNEVRLADRVRSCAFCRDRAGAA